MDNVFNKRSSIADENIKSNGRPATNEFEGWSKDLSDAEDYQLDEPENLSEEEREKRLKEMDEVVKEDLK